MKAWNILILSAVLAGWLAGTALAHKVTLFAYVEGGKVFTESFFPDGRPVAGGKLQVFDGAEKLLLEGVTDAKGLFSFAIPKVDDLTIVLDASMGHKTSFKLKKAEVEAGK
jgi:nickel transport protein